MHPLPAHSTKHLPVIAYPFSAAHHFHLAQLDDGRSNGTALWLGAQCLSSYLQEVARRICVTKYKSNAQSDVGPTTPRPRAIELGSGVGLVALALASMGWDVLATDTAYVVSSVLKPNIERNISPSFGTVQVRELDWTVPPSAWTWDDPKTVASHFPPDADPCQDRKKEASHIPDILTPPFDLILTSDTLYAPALVTPLLRTMNHLSCCSSSDAHSQAHHCRGPVIYLALENRDPALILAFLEQARSKSGFNTERVPDRKVAKAMGKGGVVWDKSEWEGVEIWKFTLAKVK